MVTSPELKWTQENLSLSRSFMVSGIKKDFAGSTLPLLRCFRPQYLRSLALPLIVGIGNRSKWITRKPNWKVMQTRENEIYIIHP